MQTLQLGNYPPAPSPISHKDPRPYLKPSLLNHPLTLHPQSLHNLRVPSPLLRPPIQLPKRREIGPAIRRRLPTRRAKEGRRRAVR